MFQPLWLGVGKSAPLLFFILDVWIISFWGDYLWVNSWYKLGVPWCFWMDSECHLRTRLLYWFLRTCVLLLELFIVAGFLSLMSSSQKQSHSSNSQWQMEAVVCKMCLIEENLENVLNAGFFKKLFLYTELFGSSVKPMDFRILLFKRIK